MSAYQGLTANLQAEGVKGRIGGSWKEHGKKLGQQERPPSVNEGGTCTSPGSRLMILGCLWGCHFAHNLSPLWSLAGSGALGHMYYIALRRMEMLLGPDLSPVHLQHGRLYLRFRVVCTCHHNPL